MLNGVNLSKLQVGDVAVVPELVGVSVGMKTRPRSESAERGAQAEMLPV